MRGIICTFFKGHTRSGDRWSDGKTRASKGNKPTLHYNQTPVRYDLDGMSGRTALVGWWWCCAALHQQMSQRRRQNRTSQSMLCQARCCEWRMTRR